MRVMRVSSSVRLYEVVNLLKGRNASAWDVDVLVLMFGFVSICIERRAGEFFTIICICFFWDK